MHYWRLLILPILGIVQPIASERNLVDGRHQSCDRLSRSILDSWISINGKYQLNQPSIDNRRLNQGNFDARRDDFRHGLQEKQRASERRFLEHRERTVREVSKRVANIHSIRPVSLNRASQIFDESRRHFPLRDNRNINRHSANQKIREQVFSDSSRQDVRDNRRFIQTLSPNYRLEYSDGQREHRDIGNGQNIRVDTERRNTESTQKHNVIQSRAQSDLNGSGNFHSSRTNRELSTSEHRLPRSEPNLQRDNRDSRFGTRDSKSSDRCLIVDRDQRDDTRLIQNNDRNQIARDYDRRNQRDTNHRSVKNEQLSPERRNWNIERNTQEHNRAEEQRGASRNVSQSEGTYSQTFQNRLSENKLDQHRRNMEESIAKTEKREQQRDETRNKRQREGGHRQINEERMIIENRLDRQKRNTEESVTRVEVRNQQRDTSLNSRQQEVTHRQINQERIIAENRFDRQNRHTEEIVTRAEERKQQRVISRFSKQREVAHGQINQERMLTENMLDRQNRNIEGVTRTEERKHERDTSRNSRQREVTSQLIKQERMKTGKKIDRQNPNTEKRATGSEERREQRDTTINQRQREVAHRDTEKGATKIDQRNELRDKPHDSSLRFMASRQVNQERMITENISDRHNRNTEIRAVRLEERQQHTSRVTSRNTRQREISQSQTNQDRMVTKNRSDRQNRNTEKRAIGLEERRQQRDTTIYKKQREIAHRDTEKGAIKVDERNQQRDESHDSRLRHSRQINQERMITENRSDQNRITKERIGKVESDKQRDGIRILGQDAFRQKQEIKDDRRYHNTDKRVARIEDRRLYQTRDSLQKENTYRLANLGKSIRGDRHNKSEKNVIYEERRLRDNIRNTRHELFTDRHINQERAIMNERDERRNKNTERIDNRQQSNRSTGDRQIDISKNITKRDETRYKQTEREIQPQQRDGRRTLDERQIYREQRNVDNVRIVDKSRDNRADVYRIGARDTRIARELARDRSIARDVRSSFLLRNKDTSVDHDDADGRINSRREVRIDLSNRERDNEMQQGLTREKHLHARRTKFISDIRSSGSMSEKFTQENFQSIITQWHYVFYILQSIYFCSVLHQVFKETQSETKIGPMGWFYSSHVKVD